MDKILFVGNFYAAEGRLKSARDIAFAYPFASYKKSL